jgi:Uma2 family endonuclease
LRWARQGLPLGEEQTMAIETRTRISNAAYERLALADDDRKWELWDGVPREKPGMSAAHNEVGFELGHMLRSQLKRTDYRVRVDSGKVHRPGATYFIPDVFLVPTGYVTPKLDQRGLEIYAQRLPLVVEIWSPTTGDYDIREKLAVYRQRGDLEAWFIHPYKRTLIAWRRQSDGSFEKSIFTSGIVRPVALPGVEIDLEALFSGIAP